MTEGSTVSRLSCAAVGLLVLACAARAQEPTRITVTPSKTRQVYDGVGAGVIFYEGHVTSLADRNKPDRQEQLYDDLFEKLRDMAGPLPDEVAEV